MISVLVEEKWVKMMFKRVVVTLIILSVIFGIFAIYTGIQNRRIGEQEIQEYEANMLNFSPEEVLEHHFRWKNDRNNNGLELTMDRWLFHENYFERGIFFEPFSISEESEEILEHGYMQHIILGLGNENAYDIVSYCVSYHVHDRRWHSFILGNSGEIINTRHIRYMMMRETAESPWVIFHWSKCI